jgi:NitT/TauT family transport system substrate-binding protein
VALSHWLFKDNATAQADVSIAAMGIDAVQQAVLTGAVDGGTVLEPAQTIVLWRDPKLRGLVTATQMFDDIPGVVVAVSGAFAKAHPEAVDTLVGLSIRASKYIGTNTDDAAGYVQPVLGAGLVDRAVLAKALRSPAVTFVTDPHAIAKSTESLLAYQVELGDFPKAPPTDGLFDYAPYDRVMKK